MNDTPLPPVADGSPVLACRGLAKTYYSGPLQVPVLLGIDLAIERGERVAIVGASGSGKSTLLSIIAGLDTPTRGTVRLAGQDSRRGTFVQRHAVLIDKHPGSASPAVPGIPRARD